MAKMTKAEMAKIVAPTLIEIQLNKVREGGGETPVNRCQWVLEHQNHVLTIPINETYRYEIGYLVDVVDGETDDPMVLKVNNYNTTRGRIITGDYPDTHLSIVGYNAYRYPNYHYGRWYLVTNLYKNDELIGVWLSNEQQIGPGMSYTTDNVYHYSISGTGRYFHEGEETTQDEYYQGQYSPDPHEDYWYVVYQKWQNIRYSGGFGASFTGWNIVPRTSSQGYTYASYFDYPPSARITGSGGGAIMWDEYTYTRNDAVAYTLPGTMTFVKGDFSNFTISISEVPLSPSSGGYNWNVWLAIPYKEFKKDLLAIYKYIFDNSYSRESRLGIEPLIIEPEEGV